MTETVKILCVDDETSVLRSLKRLFADEDYVLLTALSGEEGLKILEDERVQVVISDYRMPGMNGVEFLRRVYEQWPDAIRIVLSGYADTATVVAAINEGRIYKFIPKPWNNDELRVTIAKAVEWYFLQQKTAELSQQVKFFAWSQSLLLALPAAVLALDPQGTIIFANRKADELLGQDIVSLADKAGEALLPAEILALCRRVAAGESGNGHVLLAGRRFMAVGAMLQGDGEEDHTVVVLLLEE